MQTAPSLFALALATVATPAAAQTPSPPPPSELTDYVKKPDPSFAWELKGKRESDLGTAYELRMVSQTWQGFKWEHAIQVFVPKGSAPRTTMVLFNTGGSPGNTSAVLGTLIAQKVGGPVAFLYGIPNQPLFNKKEDALIAETFVRYLTTRDPSWPLLFPMAKSLVRAMDVLQAFGKQEWQTDVTGFVVTGASKRGWTSWLTAATGDPRVKAIAPMVIDTLNMPAQMQNQVRAFGKPSQMIHDYVERKLAPVPDTPDAKKLWAMIDPWVYREKLTLPKLIINGTNDPYWPQDALNSYWDDLKGEKYLLYVPNAGHDLRETDAKGERQSVPGRAVNTLAAFAKAQMGGKPLPRLTWKHGDADGKAVVAVESDPKPKAVRVWVADAGTRDFRQSRWAERPVGPVDYPAKGFRAFFAEAEYDADGLTYTLSTQIRILEAKK